MRRVLVLLFLCSTVYAQTQGPTGPRAQETVRNTQNSKADDHYAHVIMATQYGNATIRYQLPPGMTQHQFSWRTDPTVTGLTVTIAGCAGTCQPGGYTNVGTSTALGGTITGTGNYTSFQITYTNYIGSGAVDGDYFGVDALLASPLNTHTINLTQVNSVNVTNPQGAVPDVIERNGDVQSVLQVFNGSLLPQVIQRKLLLPCNALRTTNCQ